MRKGTLNSGHCAIDEPVGDGRLAWMRQETCNRGNSAGMHIGRFDKIVRWVVIVLRDVLHHVVPDRSGARNTNYIVHDAVVAVPGPYTHSQVRRIAHCPVIAETIGGTGFCGGWAIQLAWVTPPALVNAPSLFCQDAAPEASNSCA